MRIRPPAVLQRGYCGVRVRSYFREVIESGCLDSRLFPQQLMSLTLFITLSEANTLPNTMDCIALLSFFYSTAPPVRRRLTTAKLGEDHFRTIGQIPENPDPKYWRARQDTFHNTYPIQCVDERTPCKISIEAAEDGGQGETMWTNTYAAHVLTSSKWREPAMNSTASKKGTRFSDIKVGQINNVAACQFRCILYDLVPYFEILTNVRESTSS